MEYLEPESVNGLNLYAYCGNNPADMFGGVRGRTHTKAELARAKWYVAVGTVFFPLTYLFLI